MAPVKAVSIRPAQGRLGVLLPGMGAVATTFIAGVMNIRKGLAKPIGSLTQMGTIRLGKRTEGRSPRIGDFMPLAGLNDLVFGGWDIFADDAYEAAVKAGVLTREHLDPIKEELSSIRPWPAVFENAWVKKLHGERVKKGASKAELAEQIGEDIARFQRENALDRLVAVWCGSTEVYRKPTDVHSNLDKFERGLKDSDPEISPSQIYAYACLKARVPFANGAPNLTVDVPGMIELSKKNGAPIAGKD